MDHGLQKTQVTYTLEVTVGSSPISHTVDRGSKVGSMTNDRIYWKYGWHRPTLGFLRLRLGLYSHPLLLILTKTLILDTCILIHLSFQHNSTPETPLKSGRIPLSTLTLLGSRNRRTTPSPVRKYVGVHTISLHWSKYSAGKSSPEKGSPTVPS